VNDLSQVHARALAETRSIVAGIEAVQWNQPTPCSDWDVRGLANHVVAGNWWAAELANGRTIADVGDRLDGDILGDDPIGAYDRSAQAAADAFERPGAMDAPCAVSYGPVPGSVYCGHRIIDVLIHGWDLARATGQNTDLDPELVDACLEIVRPQAAMLIASGAFGTEVSAASATPQSELLAMLGRRG
jgi:uncharacterized protein (TIGR03086 family)